MHRTSLVLVLALSTLASAERFIVHAPDAVLDATEVSVSELTAAGADSTAHPEFIRYHRRRLAGERLKRAAHADLSIHPTHDFSRALAGFAAELTPAQVSALTARGFVVAPEGRAMPSWANHFDAYDANNNPSLGYSWASEATRGTTHPNLKVGDYATTYPFTKTTLYVLDDGMPDSSWTQDLNLVAAETVTDGPAIETAPPSNWEHHGYSVASVVGAKNNLTKFVGVVPNIPIHSIRVTGAGQVGVFEADLIAGLERALTWEYIRFSTTQGAYNGGIVNISYSGGATMSSLRTAIANATQDIWIIVGYGFFAHRRSMPGLMTVVPVGNDNTDACLKYPGAHARGIAGMVSVGSVNSGGFAALSSNVGPCVESWAPGDMLLVAYPDATGYRYERGTSLASPNYAGIAASVREFRSKLSPASLETLMMQNSLPLGTDWMGSPISMPWLAISK